MVEARKTGSLRAARARQRCPLRAPPSPHRSPVTRMQREPLSLVDARALALKMTEARIARCEHGKANRCQLCGIERIRDFEVDAYGKPRKHSDGSPVCRIGWRAIGDTAPVESAGRDPAQEPDL